MEGRFSFGERDIYKDQNEIEPARFEEHEAARPLLELLRKEALNMLRSPEPML